MSRRARCIAIALAYSILMIASSQAAPTKSLPQESALVMGSAASAWDWLVSLLRKTLTAPWLDITTAEDGSALDPNGGQH